MPKPPPNITIGVDTTPPALYLVLLAFQYAFLLCVYLVIVVIVVRAAGADAATARSAISMAMIASAVGTLLQALPRGPIGSGFLAPPVFSAIYLGPSVLAAKSGGLAAVACMTVCAGLTEIVIARFLHPLRIIMQPTISGLTTCIIALELGIVGPQHALAPALLRTSSLPRSPSALRSASQYGGKESGSWCARFSACSLALPPREPVAMRAFERDNSLEIELRYRGFRCSCRIC